MQDLRGAFFHPLPNRHFRPLRNRAEAGQKLAKHLRAYAGQANVLVLGLPRGVYLSPTKLPKNRQGTERWP
ncbi:MAG: hypothetical protein R3C14_39640 [Caldilineaceae bacterium]